MSTAKCVLEPTTRLVFLSIICDTDARRFKVPEDKLLKLEVIITAAITSGWISFVDLERLAGKCTSMSVAVPTDWSDALRIGNPIRSDLVTQHMTFTR